MKMILLLLLTWVGATVKSSGQGRLAFTNFSPVAGIDAPIFNVDGTRLEGPRFQAQLWAGPNIESLAPIAASVPIVQQGYFPQVARTIDAVPPGEIATVKVVAWDTLTGDTFEEASVRGMSAVLEVRTIARHPGAHPRRSPSWSRILFLDSRAASRFFVFGWH